MVAKPVSEGIFDAMRPFLNGMSFSHVRLTVTRDETPRSPSVPNLLMTPEIEAEIEAWQFNGVPPFRELSQCPPSDWYRYSKTDLRLIHHISGLSIDFHRRGLSGTTVWASKMPSILAIAVTSDFVMSSVLAFSASHLAYLTGSKETEALSYRHRGVAFKGLQNAIGTFSKKNCDAILTASILLSWQATDWASFASLQKGMSSVLDSMHPYWKETSDIAQFLEDQRALRSFNNMTFNPTYLSGATRYQGDDLERIDASIADLQMIQKLVQHIPEYYERIYELLTFVRQLRNDMPIQSPEKAFERLQPLRTWLFWLPTKMLRGDKDLEALSILAQFYSTALALEPLFPQIEGSYLGCMAITPIENIDAILLARKSSIPYTPSVQLAASLMEFPRHIMTDYKSCVQWSQPVQPMNHFVTTPPSPYHHFQDITYETTAPYTPSIHSPSTFAVPTSPFHGQGMYSSHPNLSAVYVSSPLSSEGGDDSLSDYSRAGGLEPSPAFSSPYSDEIHRQMPPTDASATLNIGLMHGSPIMPMGAVAPQLWT
ncbi:hypothetical protein PISL3812_06501 [Talaromyces islandicus]|uniref:Uncharacterized protein n=1 Tax=Talaromyces islandicus TaxID=28573 RepID=A0A0U1M1I7_TALIS|nr:hypothetical protein PISL3812_06501 [Talaromyces islandicus]